MNECSFYIEIDAPNGLKGIEEYIDSSLMNLEAWDSGYNGKTILRTPIGEEYFEWNMDSSNSNILVATGLFFKNIENSKENLESFSYTLSLAGFRHKWDLDDEEGDHKYSGQFKWDV